MDTTLSKEKHTNHSNNKTRWIILIIILIQILMATLDSSIVNIALPIISKDLSINMASVEWVVSSYLIVISAIILIFGKLGDIKGKTKVFSFGSLVFTLGSLLCGLSHTIELLVTSRIIQGVGAAMIMSNNQGIITEIFPDKERGGALGISGAFVALGALIGPPIGGFIISYFTWEYIFLINVPIGIIVFILQLKYFPKNISKSNTKLDTYSSLLFSISVLLIFSAILLSQQLTFSNTYIISGLILGVLLLTAFIYRQNKITFPLVDLTIFKNYSFSINLFSAFIIFVALSTTNIIQPFYLIEARGFSPSKAALIMMAYPLTLFIVSPISGYLSDKIGSKILTLIGLILNTIILIGLSFLDLNSSLPHIVILLCLTGFGNGLFQSPNTSQIMSSVPKNKLGVAGGINALVRNLGLVVGISLSTSILYSVMSTKAGYKILGVVKGQEHLFVYGMKYVYIIIGIICFITFILSLMDKIIYTPKR